MWSLVEVARFTSAPTHKQIHTVHWKHHFQWRVIMSLQTRVYNFALHENPTFTDQKLHSTQISRPGSFHQWSSPSLRFMLLKMISISVMLCTYMARSTKNHNSKDIYQFSPMFQQSLCNICVTIFTSICQGSITSSSSSMDIGTCK